MKRVFNALITALLIMPLLSLQATANTGDQASATTIEIGQESDSRLIPEVDADRFNIKVDTEQQITISSTHFPGEEGNFGLTLNATLNDESGKTIATAKSNNRGNFEITENLEPGNYTLIVTGESLKSRHESTSRYSIHVAATH